MAMLLVVPPIGHSRSLILKQWVKSDGDWVNAGSVVCILACGAASRPIIALEAGFLRCRHPQMHRPGSLVEWGTPLGWIVGPGEVASAQERIPAWPPPLHVPSTLVSHARLAALAAERASDRLPISPRARRAAERLAIDAAAVQGTGVGNRIRERDVLQASPGTPPAQPLRTRGPRKTRPPQSVVPEESTRRAATDASDLESSMAVGIRLHWSCAGKPAMRAVRSEFLTALINAIAAQLVEDGAHGALCRYDDRGERWRRLSLPDITDTRGLRHSNTDPPEQSEEADWQTSVPESSWAILDYTRAPFEYVDPPLSSAHRFHVALGRLTLQRPAGEARAQADCRCVWRFRPSHVSVAQLIAVCNACRRQLARE